VKAAAAVTIHPDPQVPTIAAFTLPYQALIIRGRLSAAVGQTAPFDLHARFQRGR